MRALLILLLVLGALHGLVGCKDTAQAEHEKAMEARLSLLQSNYDQVSLALDWIVNTQLVQLAEQVRSNTTRVATLSTNASRLFLDTTVLQSRVDKLDGTDAVFCPVEVAKPNSFHLLKTEPISLLLAVDDVEPYLDGFRLRVRLGNTSSAKISNTSLTFRWGPERTMQDYDIPEPLLPGTWLRTQVIVRPITREELASLAVHAEAKQLTLATPTDSRR